MLPFMPTARHASLLSHLRCVQGAGQNATWSAAKATVSLCRPHSMYVVRLLVQVRIKLKHMELEIRRREVTGTGAAKRTEVETLGKYEIMDGAPVRGESIPIR